MKVKTIHKVIKKKMDEWIYTLPIKLQVVAKDNIILTGGSIASMLLQEKVNDYDIYFQTHEGLSQIVEHYIKDLSKIKIWTLEDEEEEDLTRVRICVPSDGAHKYEPPKDSKYAVIYVTENALTLSGDIQIVTRFIGDAKEIHSNYDFVHATNYWTYKDGLVLNKDALASLLTKELFYVGSKYPLCSIIRTRKFVQRQFTCNAGQYLKMVLQLNEMNLKDPEVLRDQLVGVDSAYFNRFISCIDSKQKEKDLDFISTDYLCTLVDEVFNKGIEDDEQTND